MKSLLWSLCVAIPLVLTPAQAQDNSDDLQLPELHKIFRVTLSPSYSCRSKKEFRKGYAETALFLSEHARDSNSPELPFNGACKSPDYFDLQLAGDTLSVITGYGDVPLSDLTATRFFSPLKRTDSHATFISDVPVRLDHTYGVVINTSSVRGMFYFKVVGYVLNQKVELEYVVKDYQVLRVEAQSSGFDWDRKSSY